MKEITYTSLSHAIASLSRIRFFLTLVFWLSFFFIILVVVTYLGGKYKIFSDIQIIKALVEDSNLDQSATSIILKILKSVLIAPFFETFIFQLLFYNVLKNFISPVKIIFISALIFSLVHLVTLHAALFAFLAGLLLTMFYVGRVESDKRTFLLVSMAHSSINLIIIIAGIVSESAQ